MTTLLRALNLPLSKAGLGGVRRAQKNGESSRKWAPIRNWKATNLMDSEVTQDVSRHIHLFRSFRSFVLSSFLCLTMLRDCTQVLIKQTCGNTLKGLGDIISPSFAVTPGPINYYQKYYQVLITAFPGSTLHSPDWL